MFLYFIDLLFKIYTAFLFLRIMGSWFPSFRNHRLMLFLGYYTDPYLNIFRRIIPPLGGVFDLSPLLAFFALRLIQNFLLHLFS